MPRRKESRAQVGRGAVCCRREEWHVQMCGGVLQNFTELTWLERGAEGRGGVGMWHVEKEAGQFHLTIHSANNYPAPTMHWATSKDPTLAEIILVQVKEKTVKKTDEDNTRTRGLEKNWRLEVGRSPRRLAGEGDGEDPPVLLSTDRRALGGCLS